MSHDDLTLAKITNDKEWQAYRKLFAEECRLRGIAAEPLPEKRPEPSAAVKLDRTITKAIQHWQKQQPLKSIRIFGQDIKAAVSMTERQLREDSSYHYQNAKTYLENTLSGAVSVMEDTLGIANHYNQSQNYFIDLNDFLDDERSEELELKESQIQRHKTNNLLDKIVAKGTEDIAIVEQAICGFFDRFKVR